MPFLSHGWASETLAIKQFGSCFGETPTFGAPTYIYPIFGRLNFWVRGLSLYLLGRPFGSKRTGWYLCCCYSGKTSLAASQKLCICWPIPHEYCHVPCEVSVGLGCVCFNGCTHPNLTEAAIRFFIHILHQSLKGGPLHGY